MIISSSRRIWGWFRQPVSGLSHLVGAVFAVYGMILLLQQLGNAQPSFLTLKTAAVLIFGSTMTLLYLASSLYHLLPLSEKGVSRLRKLDHSAIYVFIAGSYSPVCLILLQEGKGPTIFAVVWGTALLGVLLKLLWMESSRWVRVGLYVLLASVSVVILPDVWHRMPETGLMWLFGGLLAYAVGAVVYAMKWPDPIPELLGFHELWHGFVMVGCFCHFWVVKEYLVSI